ncbi:LysR family transcriptional regulator [Cupriavidus gilardii]|nr:LysR family transcriptional regulator [Cupriavidus gilardii]
MNFRRAAERLNMAQPPLTAAIRQMEEELGVRLFERSNRITGLTAAGEVLRQEARRTIAQAERAVAMAKRAGEGSVGTLRIGFVASAVRDLVPQIVTEFRRTHAMAVLELEEATTARQIAAILTDRMDVGIVALPIPPGEEAHVSTRLLVESRLTAAIPAEHPLALTPSSPLSLGSFANEPWFYSRAEKAPASMPQSSGHAPKLALPACRATCRADGNDRWPCCRWSRRGPGARTIPIFES